MNPPILVRAPSSEIVQERREAMSLEKNIEDAECGAEPEGETQKKERQKIIRVDQIWDKKRRKFLFVKTAKPKNRKEKFGRYVITVARRISTQGTFEGHYVVDIRGPHIQEAMSEAYCGVEGLSFSTVISLETSELKLLFYALPIFFKKLEEERTKDCPDETKTLELEAAVQFVQEHFEPVITKLNELPQDHITFETIWTLFPHHILVYGTDALGQGTVYRVRSSEYGKNRDGSTYYGLDIDYLDSDGELVGYVRNQHRTIPEYSGSMSIYDLQYYPLIRHPNFQDKWKLLVARGEKILSLKGRWLQEYKGHALDEERKKFNSHGRVMIDPVTFDQIVPNNALVPVIRTPLVPDKLTPDQKALLNPLLYGFSLGDKIWGAFAVSRLQNVNWDENMAKSLVLDEKRKDFIHALVRYHGQKGDEGFDDFVRDKGKGLVGLLAGPPGVGKTYTAEAVAEIAQRPLYMISSGELGESSTELQRRLLKAFELAETWKAVVLLDEADVFLAERKDDNISRNAITSIFLRHLEYYQGILLLTTNRLDSFDEAFQSRIHFSFKYADLDAQARHSIWKKFVERAKATTGIEILLQEEDIMKLAELDLNGRQIKNIIGIAQAVAAQKKEPITLDSVRLAEGFATITWTKAKRPLSQIHNQYT